MQNYLPARPSQRLLSHSLYWLARLAAAVAAVLAVLVALIIIALRYWLLPGIEQYHSEITHSLAGAIGHPVTIGSIRGDWQGLRPHLNVTDVRILDEQRQPALVLQNIDASVSWMSLLAADLRLANLDIARPELLVRRDKQGAIFIGGVAFASQGSDHTLADWLLHQSRVVVRDALIVWLDEQRDAPPLVLQQVNLHIENLFNHHRFALRALPPNELSTPLDVRGDFSGASFGDLNEWRGQLFTQLDYTDATVWRPWLNLPAEFYRGRGALRGWLGVEEGRVVKITADLDWRDVATRLAADAPELVLLNLRGRAAWGEVPGGMEISTRKLAMKLQNGIELQPTDFYFRTARESGSQSASNEIRADQLKLQDITGLAGFLPLEADLLDRLNAYAPSGKVSHFFVQWMGALEKPGSFKIKGQFENIAVRQVGKTPGFSGLTADVDGSDAGGRLNIGSRQLVVDAPGIMREALLFNILTGQVKWRYEHGNLVVNVDNVAVANDDLAGNMYGSYRARPGTLGELDLTAGLTRGDIRRAARYTPLIALHKEGNDWLNGALLAGHTEDFSIRIKGNLSDFPPGAANGCANAAAPSPGLPAQTADCARSAGGSGDVLFKIGGHARDVVLEFAKDWPRIENITGEFSIRGNRLEVISPSAAMAGAHLQNVLVTIPDMTGDDLALEINGEAVAGNETFLQFIQKSPVRGYISGFTDGAHASGNGHLTLYTRIPLPVADKADTGAVEQSDNMNDATAPADNGNAATRHARKPVQVSGNFHVKNSDIDLGAGVPWLRNTSGVLTFTESGMQAKGVLAEILGGSASISVQTTAGNAVHAVVQGRCNLDVLPRNKALPVLNYLRGGAAYKADISVANRNAQLVISSDLLGIASTLPQPFVKRADETMPLRIEKVNVTEGQDVLTAQLDNLLSGRLERSAAGGEMTIRRGAINFGDPDNSVTQGAQREAPRTRKRAKEKDGVWVTGNVPVLSVQGWGDLAGGTEQSGPAFPLAGINLSVGKLIGYGLTVGGLQIDAAKRGDGFAVQVAGEALNGELAWQSGGQETGGKFSARLRNLHLAADQQAGQSPAAAKPVDAKPAGMLHPDDLPELEIAIENLQIKDNPVGRFELAGQPDGKDWRMRRLNITNPDGSLAGDGIWRTVPAGTQTQINLQLALADVGKTLARYGYPDTVKNGSGKLAASLSWDGTPEKLNYATLNGTLKLDTGKGRFLKMDPGAGKLLSILSLQALPKRIALDFTDVFSTGFEFDNINGNATISKGVIDTQDLHIDGSSAKVTMKGSVDLNNETQKLRVRVLPSIGSSVSLGVAFAAGPVVGIGALIVNKVLDNPLDKLVSFEYNVDGTWSNPNVVKVGGASNNNQNEQERK